MYNDLKYIFVRMRHSYLHRKQGNIHDISTVALKGQTSFGLREGLSLFNVSKLCCF